MADIAIAFHWSLAELAALDLADLARWRSHARRRLDPDDDGQSERRSG